MVCGKCSTCGLGAGEHRSNESTPVRKPKPRSFRSCFAETQIKETVFETA